MQNREFRIFIVWFCLLFVVTYSFIAVPFLYIQDMLPESQRIALDLYEPFRPLSLMTIINQLLRGIVIGIPEIFSQMLVFSVIFFFWERMKQD